MIPRFKEHQFKGKLNSRILSSKINFKSKEKLFSPNCPLNERIPELFSNSEILRFVLSLIRRQSAILGIIVDLATVATGINYFAKSW